MRVLMLSWEFPPGLSVVYPGMYLNSRALVAEAAGKIITCGGDNLAEEILEGRIWRVNPIPAAGAGLYRLGAAAILPCWKGAAVTSSIERFDLITPTTGW